MQSWDYLECVKSWEYIKSSYVLHNLKKGKQNNKKKKENKKQIKKWYGWWCGSTGA